MAVQLIMGISLLVLLHEFGHYIAARAFGIKVEKFFLFFDAWGVKLFSFKKGDTEYGIGWLPLGGYVKIAGMIDESMDKEALKQPPKDWEFRAKPAWQRLIVMIGGVVMNLIVGVIIFVFINLHYTREYIPAQEVNKTGIYAFETGKKLGFKTGDKIIAVNGENVKRLQDVLSLNVLFGAQITVERNGQNVTITIPDTTYRLFKNKRPLIIGPFNYKFKVDSVLPGTKAEQAGIKKNDKFIQINNINIESFGQFTEVLKNYSGKNIKLYTLRGNDTLLLDAQVDSIGKLGFVPSQPDYNKNEYQFTEAIKYGTKEAFDAIIVNAKGMAKIFQGKEKASDSLQGPIGMAKIYGGTWGDWYKFWKITGLISMILAVMNILPIPALDGGHVIFLLIEVFTGKKFSDEFMEKAQIAGMVILLALMLFATGNDIYKIFK